MQFSQISPCGGIRDTSCCFKHSLITSNGSMHSLQCITHAHVNMSHMIWGEYQGATFTVFFTSTLWNMELNLTYPSHFFIIITMPLSRGSQFSQLQFLSFLSHSSFFCMNYFACSTFSICGILSILAETLPPIKINLSSGSFLVLEMIAHRKSLVYNYILIIFFSCMFHTCTTYFPKDVFEYHAFKYFMSFKV